MRQIELGEYGKYTGRPKRVAWAVAEYEGQRSICPLGWKMSTSNRPPMKAISVAHTRFTHDLIVKSGCFVLAWPGEDLAEATFFCGTRSGRKFDKFKEMNLTPVMGTIVQAPLIEECLCNLECRLVSQLSTGDHTIFVGEVVAAHLNDDPKKLLCLIDDPEGNNIIFANKGYRFGVVE